MILPGNIRIYSNLTKAGRNSPIGLCGLWIKSTEKKNALQEMSDSNKFQGLKLQIWQPLITTNFSW